MHTCTYVGQGSHSCLGGGGAATLCSPLLPAANDKSPGEFPDSSPRSRPCVRGEVPVLSRPLHSRVSGPQTVIVSSVFGEKRGCGPSLEIGPPPSGQLNAGVRKEEGLQGVVTYAPPVEAFATGIKNFDRRNRPLIA